MRYEVILIAQNPTRCVTTRLKADDVRDLAEKLLEAYHEWNSFVRGNFPFR